jgi:anti-sigma regulatory factor (Ser/Thr protein kinase)/CheY-like chemotaxis protein
MASASTGPAPIGSTEQVFAASPAMLREIRAFVTRLATAAGIPDAELHRIVLVTNEAATNAIEHSGSDVVRVGWEHGDSGVWITVADEGVFNVTGGSAHDRGWGLKVVLALADEVTVRAGRRGEHGTTIRTHIRTRSPVSAAPVGAPAGAPDRVRLLVVDADRFSGRSLSSFLTAEGYQVALAASVSAGRDALADPPGLVIVDVMASNGVAAGLCEEITRAGIPVLAMSVLPPPAGLRSDRFVRKPAHPLEVLTLVQQMLAPDVASDPVDA